MLRELEVGDWAIARSVSEWMEILAVVVIAVGLVVAAVAAIRASLSESAVSAHAVFKDQIARALLIGLDVLIAADVIRTVTLEPTLENVAALGLLVLVRTFPRLVPGSRDRESLALATGERAVALIRAMANA